METNNTYTIDIPHKFFEDHADRGLLFIDDDENEPVHYNDERILVKRLARTYRVHLNQRQLDALWSDAEYYGDPVNGFADFDSGLVASARSLEKKLRPLVSADTIAARYGRR